MGMRQMAYRASVCGVLCLLCGLSLGCSNVASVLLRLTPGPYPTATGAPPAVTPAPSPPSPTPLSVASPLSLTVWVAEEFSPRMEPLAAQVREFELMPPVVQVVLRPKRMEGPGGLVNLLTTAAPVAPSALPDVAIVSASQVKALAQQGLLYSWDQFLPVNSEEDSFPLAQRLGYHDAQRMGMPLALDVQHVIYNTSDVLMRPASWRDIMNGRAHYLFPAAGKGDALDTFLIQYAMAGGELEPMDDEGILVLQERPLATALARYQGIRMARVVAPEALQVESVTACWPLYLSNQVGIAQVWASDYLAQRSELQHTDFVPIPSSSETRITVGRGWLMVLVTKDPSRQESAARLLDWWRASEHNTALCDTTGWLPPTRTSFAQWQHDDAYCGFLQEQLEVARPQLDLPSPLASALSDAIGEVLQGEATAQEAAAHLTSLMNP
jgi:ABC-type glycerol-3-phosphate transport system substrate-binding protein